MNRFKPGSPTPGCAFPKPVREKRRVSKGKDVAKTNKNITHDDILWGCISVLQDKYPEFGFYHVPNSLYSLISTSGDLSHVFARSIGFEASSELKQEIADSIKGVADLVVWSPVVAGKTKLSIMGEIKCGSDHIRASQRDWAKGALFEWRSVAEFEKDMLIFADICDKFSKGS